MTQLRIWEETQKRGVFPKLDDLIEFIYKRAARASPSDFSGSSNNANNKQKDDKKSNNKSKGKGTSQTFVTSATGYKCPVCTEKHQLYRCSKFKEFSIPKRMETAKKSSVCLLCLRSHDDKECKFKKCLICDRKENFLLHEHNSSQDE